MIVLSEKSERKMPRSNGTYGEYEQFLVQLHKSYEWLKDSAKESNREQFTTVSNIIKELAIRGHVSPPADLLWNPEYPAQAFSSSREVLKSMEKFRDYFKVSLWNMDDILAVGKLKALIVQECMQF
jgi:hypothetical protein